MKPNPPWTSHGKVAKSDFACDCVERRVSIEDPTSLDEDSSFPVSTAFDSLARPKVPRKIPPTD